MDDQGLVVVEIEKDVFAASVNKSDRGARKPFGELVRRGLGRKVFANQSGLKYSATAYQSIQRFCNEFNFR